MSSSPAPSLVGRRVVVTRAPHQSGELGAALAALGAEVVELPTIEIRATDDLTALDDALDAPERYGFAVLGSKNAAELFFRRARTRGIVLSLPIACVGAKTKAFVEGEPWIRAVSTGPVVAPDVHRAEALLELVAKTLGPAGTSRPRRVLFPRAAEGRETLIDGLRAAGIEVDAPTIYHIVPAAPAPRAVVDRVATADVLTFLSGETLRAFLEVVGDAEARAILAHACVAVIGPVARDKALALGVRVDVVPPSATVEALVGAIAVRLGAPPGRREV